MVAEFNGSRLKKARIYRQMTVEALANKCGFQRQTLSMYEISKSRPVDRQIVEKLAGALRFPVQFFYEKSEQTSVGTVYFRSLLTTNKRYRNEQIVKMEFIQQVYALLRDYIEFPRFDPPILKENCTPEDAAMSLRDHWKLGREPIMNLVSEVEQHGVLVTSFATSTNDVDAFSEYIDLGEDPTYLIAYSSNKTSAARIHFDIAHELGHICLHEWSDDIEELSRDEYKSREVEANEFASAFLLPAETFGEDASSGPQTIQYYKQLKKKWKVSIAAMILRAHRLKIMSDLEYTYLFKTLQRRGLRKIEPLDDELHTAAPSLLKTAVLMLLQENVFTPDEFMSELSENYNLTINPQEVEYLLDLPAGTLSIIDFSSIQLQLHRSTQTR